MLHKGLTLAICVALLFGSLRARAATPANGVPNSATRPNVTPTNGSPALENSTTSHSISLDVFENSLLFGNQAVFQALTQHPLTAGSLTDTSSATYPLWSDPMSILLMSYIWSNAHRTGDDLVYCPTELTLGTCTNSADPTFFLFGALGVCDYSPANPMATSPAPAAGQRGWATDEPLTSDFACQHWMSALLLSESNNFGVHNLFSAMGPSSSAAPGTIGQQLTMAASAVRGDQYYFGTETPVRSITDGCAVGTTGPANCGWTTAFIGTCTPSDTVTMNTQNTTAIPSMVMVNQGIHANDYPFLPPGKGISDSNFLGGATGAGTLQPSVLFQCPQSGTFNIQWAPYSRDDVAALGSNTVTFTASSRTGAALSYPSNELDIYPRSNREGYFAGNVFTNINPLLYSCEVRVNQPLAGSTTVIPGPQLCNPNVSGGCVPCQRGTIDFATLPDGSQVPASDVSTVNFSPRSVLGGAQDYWQPLGVNFNSTGNLLEAFGPSINSDGWCPNNQPNYSCAPNNIVVENSPSVGQTFDTLKVTFNNPQPAVEFDIADGYLCQSITNQVTLFNSGLLVATMTLTEANEIAACPNQSADELCGRFKVSAPGGAAFDEIDLAPTTCFAQPTCTLAAGDLGNTANCPGPSCPTNCGGMFFDNLTFPLGVVVFPDAHMWLGGSFANNAYAEGRMCSSDSSSCLANYEGSIDSGLAPCLSLDLDADTANPRSYSGAARPLYDVGGCYFNNNGSGTQVPAQFIDSADVGVDIYPAYGVTSFFANYGAGIDGFGSVATATATPTTSATATPAATATATPTATDTATSTPTATSATATSTATTRPTATPTSSTSVTASIAFAKTAVGQTSTKTVTVTNTGRTNPLIVSAATPSDPEYALSGTGTCGGIPVTLAHGTHCTLGISFSPSAVGPHPASLMLSDNAISTPQYVTLTGTGIAGLTTTKSILVFGNVKFGAKGVEAFSVVNHQTQSVNLSETFGGANAADFSVSGGTCTTTLAALKACSIIVSFSPGALGTESATLSVSDSPDPLSPYNVAFITSPTIPATVLRATLAYGTLTSKAPTKTKTVTVTNLSGFPLSLSESISGPNATDFTVTGGTCIPTETASPNSTCTIAVTFTATANPSPESASMTVTVGSDPSSPYSISLTGAGP